MNLPKKYYEELYFSCGDDRNLLPQNQDAIIELLDKNGAVGVVGVYDEPEYPIYFISGFALTAIGYSYQEVMKASEGSFLQLVYEKDRHNFTECLKNPNVSSHEFRMINQSGRNVWVNSYKKTSSSIDGRPIIIASIRVVEDARKRESELLDALTKGYNRIIYVDVNQGRYRIIKSEQGGLDEQVCGTLTELEELLHQYGRDYINPEDHSFATILNKLNFFSNPGENGGNYKATYRALIDGEYQWVQFQAFYGGAMNLDTGHIILAFRIVDEEKRRELDAHRILSDSLAQAEEASHIKNEFLSRMSHDLRTPINGIMGMLEIAKANRANPEKIDECIEKISLACSNLVSLVQDVLDMHDLENSNVELLEENINLSEFFKDDLKWFCRRAEESGLRYTIQCADFPHPYVVGSPRHIRQVFDHVLDNAIKYNKPNGSVTVRGRELSCNGKTATFEFVVEDTGLGMGKEFLKSVFEPFEQEHNTSRTKYMGTGLGMSIAKRLVEQMEGTIAVESQLGVGTKVTFTLPFRLCKDAVEPQAAPKNIDLALMNVLLAEDNELNMEIAQFLLESAGMVVSCASNGQEAVEIFRQSEENKFDVILMDIMMPVMNGLEAAKAIRRLDRPDAKTVPIIALSANVMDSDVMKTKMAGMDDHLAKPIDASQLLSSILKCIHT